MGYLYEACDQISDFCHQQSLRKMWRKISWTDGRIDRGKTVYPPPPLGSGGIISRQTGSRNLTGPKNATHNMVYLYDTGDQISDSCHQQLLRKIRRKISWTDKRTGQTDSGKTIYPPPSSGSGGIKNSIPPPPSGSGDIITIHVYSFYNIR
jgi:hypothetical protein